MRIVTLNANGIRSAARKGFFQWLRRQRADVVCVQETRAQVAQLQDAIFHPRGFHTFYADAEKKGYSGVAIYSRERPARIVEGIGDPDVDREGRYLEARFGNLTVVSLYAPSGTSGEQRQRFKYRFMDTFMPFLRRLARRRSEHVICGDWNIAHKEVDLKNWRGNRNNSGFLPAERAWMDALFGEARFVDAFRVVEPGPEHYTWWSNRGRAWARNVGWRIDYQVVTPGLADKVRAASIYKRRRFSDHAPLTIDYEW